MMVITSWITGVRGVDITTKGINPEGGGGGVDASTIIWGAFLDI